MHHRAAVCCQPRGLAAGQEQQQSKQNSRWQADAVVGHGLIVTATEMRLFRQCGLALEMAVLRFILEGREGTRLKSVEDLRETEIELVEHGLPRRAEVDGT